jgi:hypothetical protein
MASALGMHLGDMAAIASRSTLALAGRLQVAPLIAWRFPLRVRLTVLSTELSVNDVFT